MADERNPKPAGAKPAQPAGAEPKPNPNVQAPPLIWVSKGYDPRKPNPKHVREAIERRQRSR